MKRLSIILLSLILAFSLVACGNNASADETGSTDSNIGDNDVTVPDGWFSDISSGESEN